MESFLTVQRTLAEVKAVSENNLPDLSPGRSSKGKYETDLEKIRQKLKNWFAFSCVVLGLSALWFVED
jgi:hypothetical protein